MSAPQNKIYPDLLIQQHKNEIGNYGQQYAYRKNAVSQVQQTVFYGEQVTIVVHLLNDGFHFFFIIFHGVLYLLHIGSKGKLMAFFVVQDGIGSFILFKFRLY